MNLGENVGHVHTMYKYKVENATKLSKKGKHISVMLVIAKHFSIFLESFYKYLVNLDMDNFKPISRTSELN